MTDEMLRKVITFGALMSALKLASGVRWDTYMTEDEADIVIALLKEADAAIDTATQIALMKTMLREHLADILATTKEASA